MKTTNFKIGQRVALSCGNFEYKTGNVTKKDNQLILVKFDLGYSRWCNSDNLEIVTKK